MKKVLLLGAGLVGYPMALDLAKTGEFDLSVADFNENSISRLNASGINAIKIDLSDTKAVESLVIDYDLILDAVPGYMGFQTFKTVIEAGKDIVDIAFFPEDPFVLNDLAKSKGVTAIMDMGVAPGMSNILIGYADHLLDKTSRAVIYVGGLPKIRTWPYEYKAVFSPIDVIEEYTRTARFVRNGKIVEMPALTEAELMDFQGIGTLEAFNSDGLRSLMFTIDAPEMIEKTLRYPGHIEKMKVLRETGFFSYDEIIVNGHSIRPIDLTTKLLFPKWKLEEGEEDVTIMQVIIEGISSGKMHKYQYDLLDQYNKETKVHSMARTTGYAATAALRMLANGSFPEKGVIVPEVIGKYPDCVKFILDELKQRGVVYREEITPL